MANQTDQDDRWLDVLAGRSQPRDAVERQAGSLRRYFELQAQHDAQIDPQAMKRMENMVRNRLSAAGQPATAQPVAGPLRRFVAWLLPSDGGHARRYALVAAVALAVVAGPMVLNRGEPGPDDSSVIKSPAPLAVNEVLIHSGRPEQDAEVLRQYLEQQNVGAQVLADGGDTVLDARVPADRSEPVRLGLAEQGVALPADGHLRLRFRKSP